MPSNLIGRGNSRLLMLELWTFFSRNYSGIDSLERIRNAD
jgi:hypothetical protein